MVLNANCVRNQLGKREKNQGVLNGRVLNGNEFYG